MFEIHHVTKETLTEEILDQLVSVSIQLSSSVTKETIKRAISSSQNHVLMACHDQKVVGTATMAFLYCITGVRVHIEDVVVDVEYRGKGIAQLLMTEAVHHAKQIGAKTIDLTSRPDREAANRLYRKLGFVPRDTNVYRYCETS